jgi:hypothetical protein
MLMAIVDAEGRLFGRWNFFDAVVVILGVALLPLGYAAYTLFRTPAPRLLAVEPAELVEGENLQVTIRGENLRPYLRISFSAVQGKSFLYQDSSRAVVELNPMGPGTYDVVLYDYGQERHRLPNAFTIKPLVSLSPTSEVVVTGRFINLTQEVAAGIRLGPLAASGELIEVLKPRPAEPRVHSNGLPTQVTAPEQFEVAASAKLPCVIKVTQGYPTCGGADYSVQPNYVLTIPRAGGPPMAFQIDQIRSIEPVRTISARVRFVGLPEAIAAVRAGDVDTELVRNPFSLGMKVTSVESGADRVGVLSIRAQRLAVGWSIGTDVLRVGNQYPIRTDRYFVGAVILSIDDDSP